MSAISERIRVLHAARMAQSASFIVPAKGNLWEDYPRQSLRLKYFDQKGRGVIAGVDIPTGALIERAPVVVIPREERPLVDETIVFTYAFLWEKGTTDQDMYAGQGRLAIPLGFATLLNHSSHPNAECVPHVEKFAMDICALRDIREGEEITVEYKMDLWF